MTTENESTGRFIHAEHVCRVLNDFFSGASKHPAMFCGSPDDMELVFCIVDRLRDQILGVERETSLVTYAKFIQEFHGCTCQGLVETEAQRREASTGSPPSDKEMFSFFVDTWSRFEDWRIRNGDQFR